MAFPGTGFRSVVSMGVEISNHLVENIVNTTITPPITPLSTPQTVAVALFSTAMYVGAQIVVDSGLAEEIVTLIAANQAGSTITAIFTQPHPANCPILGATFPLQAATDPLFTQLEILSYMSRAQNEFLSQVPCVFSLNLQTVQYGNIIQQLVCDAIEMHRIACSSADIAIVTLTRTNNVVTAVSASPHGLSVNSKFAVFGGSDPSFDGSFAVGTIISPTSWSYTQVLANSSSTEGTAGLWVRLYELSQTQLFMQDPNYRNNFVSSIRSWFQDRTGLYQFGVNGRPSANLPIEVLVSIRDANILAWTDGFLVPDPLLHYVKYGALKYIWSKDGVQNNPSLSKYAGMRFDRGVVATRRWMSGMLGEYGRSAVTASIEAPDSE